MKMCFLAAKSLIFKCENRVSAPNAMTATANVIEAKGELNCGIKRFTASSSA